VWQQTLLESPRIVTAIIHRIRKISLEV